MIIMKKLKHIGWATLLLLSITSRGLSQTVRIFFVAPTATINASFPGAGSTTDMPTGYSSVQLTAANEATFQAMPLPRLKYVYGVLQTGTPVTNLRDKVFNNSDRTVDVDYFLTDDRTAFTDRSGKLFIRPDENDGNKLYIWPAANSRDQGNGRSIGWIGLGEHQLNANQARPPVGGLLAMDEVVLHETSHTQWTGAASKWPATSSGFIAYGADGAHYVTELLGDQPLPLNEGLGTFYGYTVNRPGMNNLYAHLAADNYFVENRSVLAGDPILNAIPSRTRFDVKDSHGNPILVNGIPVVFWLYPWKDIPGFYLLFSENTSTAFYSLYWDNAYNNKDTAFAFIGFSAHAMRNNQLTRYLTYSVNRIALKMEDYNATAAGQADASRTSSMLPFAILDLVTHFSMSDADYKADYDRNYPDRQPRAYTEYFTNHRNALRTLVQADLAANPVNLLAAMAKIKTYCQAPATIF